ncbi:MAG TPA: thymidine phosphorylase [Alphaproteobacteria bacterium]
MLPQDIIRLKRDKKTLDKATLQAYVDGVAQNKISDAQIAAFSMAALLNGLNPQEVADLTMAMVHSGKVLHWKGLNGPVIDKHSTGGVGDKVSLMLAPMAAACGLYVPMIVGRGLGHTGGTRDKLDVIPGFNSALSLDQFQKIVADLGCAIIGQTADFAPADGRIYAVRDVTATVENIELITASILSKKIAAGLQGLVIDVKFGNGAFMADKAKAEALGQSLQKTAALAGLRLTPVLTDMNSVLGHSVGHTVELVEAIEYLRGDRRDLRLHDVTKDLLAEMLVLGGKAMDRIQGKRQAQTVLDNGKAAEIFNRMIAAQGGPANLINDYKRIIPVAPKIIDIMVPGNGLLRAMRTREIGLWLVEMGAGRVRVEDQIDPVIGISDMIPIGTQCVAGKTLLCRLHLRRELSVNEIHQFYQLFTIV